MLNFLETHQDPTAVFCIPMVPTTILVRYCFRNVPCRAHWVLIKCVWSPIEYKKDDIQEGGVVYIRLCVSFAKYYGLNGLCSKWITAIMVIWTKDVGTLGY